MKTKSTYWFSGMFRALVLGAGLVTSTLSSVAQDTRFFRIAGPVATGITEFRPDGTLVWTNTPTNATFIVQTATSLAGASNWVDYVQTPATNGITTNRVIDLNPPAGMALIPAGNFTMGDTFGEGSSSEVPTHSVYVSAFYMDRYEVTKALWDDVYNWAITNGYSFEHGAAGKASNHPAQNMTWYDAVKWCNARSEKDGRTPAYYTDAAQTTTYRSGQTNVQNDWVKWTANGYRLPTEAEWEKAARGGSSGQRFPWGATINQSQANFRSYWPSGSGTPYFSYDVNSTAGPHPSFQAGGYPYTNPVGYFAPNGYGLYDMTGNVWDWCWDWYKHGYEAYSSSLQTDPRGPSGSYRLIRGGSWWAYANDCRLAGRGYLDPYYVSDAVGFRSVLPLVP